MEKKDVPLISFSAVFDGGVIKDGSTSGHCIIHSRSTCDLEQQTIRNHKLILSLIFMEAMSALMQMPITRDCILSL